MMSNGDMITGSWYDTQEHMADYPLATPEFHLQIIGLCHSHHGIPWIGKYGLWNDNLFRDTSSVGSIQIGTIMRTFITETGAF